MQKKGNLMHNRPSLPSAEKITHDLAEASVDDVIFKIKDSYVCDSTKELMLSEDDCEIAAIEESEIFPATAYMKVDSFLREKSKLASYLITLSEQKANLSQWKENLLEKMNSIKKELSKPSFL